MANITGQLKYFRQVLAAIFSIAVSVASAPAWADRMDPGSFSAGVIVDQLADVYPVSAVLNHSIVRDGFTIHSNVASFVYNSWGGADGNGYLLPNSPAGIATIVFDNPWQMAAVWVANVGVTQVNFFGGEWDYLGGVTWVSGGGWAPIAWDGGAGGIKAIQVVEGEYGRYIGLDDIMRQNQIVPIPEPETYAMMLAGLGLLGFVAGRRRRHSAV